MSINHHNEKTGDGARGERSERLARDDRRLIEKAQTNLKNYIGRGIVHENFVAIFFSLIQKMPAHLEGALASVTMTDRGIRLVYDIGFFATAKKEAIDFILSHELLHVVSRHFLRSDALMAELTIGTHEFYSRYAPFADLPVNYALASAPGYPGLEETLFTYEKAGLAYETYPTFESLVRYLGTHPEEMKEASTRLGLCDDKGDAREASGGSRVIIVHEDGSTDIIREGKGTVVVALPEIAEEGKRECEKDIAEIIEITKTMAGTCSSEIQKMIRSFLDDTGPLVTGWETLEALLVGERAINKGSVRSYSRLSRRTQRLPGRKMMKGFSALFIVDESGSMSDDEIRLAFALIKKTVLKENNDAVYVVHWDVQPVGHIDEIRYEHDVENLMRHKQGGTDFADFFRHAIFREHDYDLYVCVTDGFPCAWPLADADKPVVWIITQANGYKAWKSAYAAGHAVCVAE